MQVRNMLTFIAVLWLAFCTFFVFMWAVLAQDNKLILTIATDLIVRFSFGEIVTNPLVAFVLVATIPAIACYVIMHDVKRQFTKVSGWGVYLYCHAFLPSTSIYRYFLLLLLSPARVLTL